MIPVSRSSEGYRIPFRSLVPFLLITFGIAWGILTLYILLPDVMTGAFGRLTGEHPLFFLAVYSPAIAAVIIVAFRTGTSGVRNFLSRVLLWRCPAPWYLFLIAGIPLLFYIGAAMKGALSGGEYSLPAFKSLIVPLLLTIVKGPVEEFGWRGLALPLLQRRFAPVWAGLVLGIIWGFWHLPAFLLSGTPQGAWSFTPFFIGSVAVSVIMTGVFNASRGSILLPALFHFQFNNPIWPDAQPYDMYPIIVAAAAIVWIDRRTMFGKEKGVTRVIAAAQK
jgi:hypothetical protein